MGGGERVVEGRGGGGKGVRAQNLLYKTPGKMLTVNVPQVEVEGRKRKVLCVKCLHA